MIPVLSDTVKDTLHDLAKYWQLRQYNSVNVNCTRHACLQLCVFKWGEEGWGDSGVAFDRLLCKKLFCQPKHTEDHTHLASGVK